MNLENLEKILDTITTTNLDSKRVEIYLETLFNELYETGTDKALAFAIALQNELKGIAPKLDEVETNLLAIVSEELNKAN